MAEGVPRDQIYGVILYVLAALLAAGFVCNTLIRPVKAKWHLAEEKGKKPAGHATVFGAISACEIGRGSLDAKVVVAWTAVGIPLSWGVWKTLENAAKIFL
jgi:hypothetical protein